jgi:hypothetical protein
MHKEDAQSSAGKDVLRETLEDVRKFMEQAASIKGQHEYGKSFDLGFLPYLATMHSLSGKSFSPQPFVIHISPEMNPLRDFIIGFKNHTCKKCFTINPLPIFAIAGTYLADVGHKCNEKKLSEIEGLAEQEKTDKVANMLVEFPIEMSKAIKTWWITQADPCLHSVRLREASQYAIDADKLAFNVDHWLSKSVNGGDVILHEAELEEFLFLAFGNTFCTIRKVHGQGDQKEQDDYFLVLSKDSKLPSLFSTPDQGWITAFEKHMENGWASVANGSLQNSQ